MQKPHRNVVGCLQRHENSPHLFFHYVKIMHFNVQNPRRRQWEERPFWSHELRLINISDHRAVVCALKWDLGRPISTRHGFMMRPFYKNLCYVVPSSLQKSLFCLQCKSGENESPLSWFSVKTGPIKLLRDTAQRNNMAIWMWLCTGWLCDPMERQGEIKVYREDWQGPKQQQCRWSSATTKPHQSHLQITLTCTFFFRVVFLIVLID